MKLLAAAVVPLSSFLVDAAVYRLRGHGSNHTQTEHHKVPGCDEYCQVAALFNDPCTYDFSGMNMAVTCSGCQQCQTPPTPSPAIIEYKSRHYPSSNGRLNLDYPETFVNAIKNSASGAGYCELNLTEAEWKNEHTCNQGSIRNVAFTITVKFDNHIGSNWHFDFGVDFGWGGVIYMDGTKMKAYSGDIWWSLQENHANHLGFGTFLSKGRHTMTVYGAEGCCDGDSRIKFCANCETASNMELLSISNLAKAVDHFMEMGSFAVTVGQNQHHTFTGAFETPPVVVISGGNNSLIQVSQVSTTGFSTRAITTISSELKYLAVEPGSHRLPDGRTIEAGLKTWVSPYNNLVFDFIHDYGNTAPAFEVTWVASQMESAPGPGVSSNLLPQGAELTAVQASQPPGQPQPPPQSPGQPPVVEWIPPQEWQPPAAQLSAVHGFVQTIGYVAMPKGEGVQKAQGDNVEVNYNSTKGLFEWSLDSFVI